MIVKAMDNWVLTATVAFAVAATLASRNPVAARLPFPEHRRFHQEIPMRIRPILLALAAVACLAGCKQEESVPTSASTHGRYLGVGIYRPDTQWTRLAASQDPKDDASARLADDQAIIVVVDSETGEIRSCGDLSGVCIGMNPWTKPLATTQGAPVALTRHVRTPVDSPEDSGADAGSGAATESPAASHR